MNVMTVDHAASGVTVSPPVHANAIPFTMAPMGAAGPTGAMALSFARPGGGGTTILNAIAVNGGNTILLQGQSERFSGVCQF